MFSHSPTEGHLDCFQFENLFTNKVVISIYIQFLVCTEIFIFLNAQEWNAQLQGSCMVNLIRNCQNLLQKNLCHFTLPVTLYESSVAPHCYQSSKFYTSGELALFSRWGREPCTASFGWILCSLWVNFHLSFPHNDLSQFVNIPQFSHSYFFLLIHNILLNFFLNSFSWILWF